MSQQSISPTILPVSAVKAELTKAEYKMSKLRNRPDPNAERLRKPRWIKAKSPKPDKTAKVAEIKQLMRRLDLHSVCEEASCPNLAECFSHGTATFMIMGHICTRKCPFCDVTHGRPQTLDKDEPAHLAEAIGQLGLRYVVITSVDRDDLRDGGAAHFAQCVTHIRQHAPDIKIEILVPDFRGNAEGALQLLQQGLPDVFNHNLETVPRLYETVRPGANYQASLSLLADFKSRNTDIPTKSGIMVGLGEEIEEIKGVMRDLRAHNVNMITIGQYLQPSRFHLPVARYVTPDEFDGLAQYGYSIGFDNVASGPMVRSSYHADLQAHAID